VFWRNKELIEVRVDITSGMTFQERSRAFMQTINQFNDLATESFGFETILKESINCFPLIGSLYNSDEGKIGELAFSTDEGSIKLEKMRRGGIDLRAETYHRAGKQAVHHITPYRLAILWKFSISEELETQPELLLPGKVWALNHSTQNLDEVFITKCSGLEDYNFILEKIITYLQ
jgi:hypothetical protein